MARELDNTLYNSPPAFSPDDAEDELVSMAVELARQRLSDGTASNQLVAEIIKMGTAKERLQKEKLRRENEMLRAKTEAIKSQKQAEALASEAIAAFKLYAGITNEYEEDNEY